MRLTQSVTWVLAGVVLAAVPVALSGQSTAKQNGSYSYADSPSRWDIFAGVQLSVRHTGLSCSRRDSHGDNFYTWTIRRIGAWPITSTSTPDVQVETDEHIPNQSRVPCTNCGKTWGNADFAGGGGGLIFRYPSAIADAVCAWIGGAERWSSTPGRRARLGHWVDGGGGLDFETPWHTGLHSAFQADYQYVHTAYGRVYGAARISTRFI